MAPATATAINLKNNLFNFISEMILLLRPVAIQTKKKNNFISFNSMNALASVDIVIDIFTNWSRMNWMHSIVI